MNKAIENIKTGNVNFELGKPIVRDLLGDREKHISSLTSQNKDLLSEIERLSAENHRLNMQLSSYQTEGLAYQRGRENEQNVVMDFIRKWDGKENSAFGIAMHKTMIRLIKSSNLKDEFFKQQHFSTGFDPNH